jgi:hypothetical protein
VIRRFEDIRLPREERTILQIQLSMRACAQRGTAVVRRRVVATAVK